MAVRKKIFSAADFDEFIEMPENRDLRFEFIDGEIIELPSNPYSSEVAMNSAFFLKQYGRQHNGHVTGEGAGYMVAGARLSADVAYVSKARQPELAQRGYNPIPPDLAVEVVSPTDKPKDIQRKLQLYAEAGVLVWMIYPKRKQIEVHA